MIKINRKIKRVFSLLILLFVYVFALGQGKEFKYRAAIQKIDSSDVYKIELQPSLIAKCVQKGWYDVRLIDSKGKYVAYAITDGIPSDNTSHYIDFPSITSNSTVDTATVYIAENTRRLNINQLWLKLKNTDVDRSVSLQGSDDLKQWFAIKENISLQPAGDEAKPEYEQLLTFPTSNYRYFKIQVNGKNKVPVKILQSGIYNTSAIHPEFAQLPPAKLSVKDTNKITSIFIDFGEPFLVSKLHLNITAPKFYSRDVTVYDLDAHASRLSTDVLSSSGTQDILVSAKTKRIRLDISNGDDNPLIIKSIDAWQQKKFAISYLESGQNYYILAGDSSAQDVSYDLSFLKAKSLSAMHIIGHSQVDNNPAHAKLVFKVKRDYTQLIWIAIAVVLILLSLLTWRMVKELNAKPKE